jgi:hypothetical protein
MNYPWPNYRPHRSGPPATAEQIAAAPICQSCIGITLVPYGPQSRHQPPPGAVIYVRSGYPAGTKYFVCPDCNPAAIIPPGFEEAPQ